MISLEINLREFNLNDMLQFLNRVKKTGIIRIKGGTSGDIYIKDGLVVHATDGSEKGLEVLFNLSFAELEKASFESNVAAPEQTISEDLGKLSEDIEKRRIEFEQAKQHLPPMDTALAKSTKDLEAAVALRRTDWQILALLDGKRSLNEVIVQSKLGGYEAIKTIIWLKEKGLIYDPKEAERIMAGLIRYLQMLFENFGKNGLDWLRGWAETNPDNKKIFESLNIHPETFEIAINAQLISEQIKEFLKSFDEYLNLEAPKTYGKLLAKKKLEEFREKVKRENRGGER